MERLDATPPQGWRWIEVSRRKGERAGAARVSVRSISVQIQPPQQRQHRESLLPIPLQAILAREDAPPKGVEPLRWWLLTTLPIQTAADAERYAHWYRYRWLIERYHFVLKSGGRIEELQLKTAAGLERALATYSIVAWRLLWLTYQARVSPDVPCDEALTAREWPTLYRLHHRTSALPHARPALRDAVRWIAQMGGFLARKGDGEPGVKTLWIGWGRLQEIVNALDILQTPDEQVIRYG